MRSFADWYRMRRCRLFFRGELSVKLEMVEYEVAYKQDKSNME